MSIRATNCIIMARRERTMRLFFSVTNASLQALRDRNVDKEKNLTLGIINKQ